MAGKLINDGEFDGCGAAHLRLRWRNSTAAVSARAWAWFGGEMIAAAGLGRPFIELLGGSNSGSRGGGGAAALARLGLESASLVS